jgi:hypothetical protein
MPLRHYIMVNGLSHTTATLPSAKTCMEGASLDSSKKQNNSKPYWIQTLDQPGHIPNWPTYCWWTSRNFSVHAWITFWDSLFYLSALLLISYSYLTELRWKMSTHNDTTTKWNMRWCKEYWHLLSIKTKHKKYHSYKLQHQRKGTARTSNIHWQCNSLPGLWNQYL